MQIIQTKIPDVLVLKPKVFEDERGFFFESFNASEFKEATHSNLNFVQDNHSMSSKGVLRGLHFQTVNMQAKLVRVIFGEIFDVAVDLRKDSSTYGNWVSEVISAENKKQLWIPEGFAHGFLTLSEKAEVLYKTSDFYNKEFEKTIKWNDSTLNIEWPNSIKPILSAKDNIGLSFKEI